MLNNISKFIISSLLTLLSLLGYSQNDTIITNDHTILVGEVKEMSNGVITMKTSYSDSDFKIEYLQIIELISERTFSYTLSNGDRYFGTITVDTTTNQLRIFDIDKGFVIIQAKDLVHFKQIDNGNIFDILNLALDLGYSFTKTNNLHQFNGSIHFDYYRKKWGISGNTNTIQNLQDDVVPISRTNGGVEIKIFHNHNYFSSITANYFSNNEQQIQLRSTYNSSFGKYFIRTNKIYFNTSLGLAYTIENYSDTTETNRNLEGKFGIEFNMFDMGDLNMFTSAAIYPSITEKGRFRFINKFNLKYDLPRDFYIKATLDYSYDNKPIEGVTPDDYVYTFGIGWEL